MSAALVSSPRSRSDGIPAGVMAAVHFRQDYARLLEAVTFENGIPELLFDGLESEDATVVLRSVKGLSPLFENVTPKETFQEFLLLGGHILLALTLRKWMHHVDIVTHCCCLMARMIQKYEVGDRNFPIVRPLRRARCVDDMVTALAKYHASREVQLYGIAALGNLCSGSNHYSDASQAAQRLVNELDGVNLAVNAMKQFPQDEPTQEVVCCFLARLCFLGLGETPALKEKALLHVSEAVKRYPDNRIIEKNAAKFMAAVLHP